jgi:hypothetical protein
MVWSLQRTGTRADEAGQLLVFEEKEGQEDAAKNESYVFSSVYPYLLQRAQCFPQAFRNPTSPNHQEMLTSNDNWRSCSALSFFRNDYVFFLRFLFYLLLFYLLLSLSIA